MSTFYETAVLIKRWDQVIVEKMSFNRANKLDLDTMLEVLEYNEAKPNPKRTIQVSI